MNVYSENLTVTRSTVMALSSALTSSSVSPSPTFLKSHVVPFLCAPTVNQDLGPLEVCQIINQTDNHLLSLSDMICLLEYDILFIYEQISSLKDEASFCVRHVDLWLVRLSCRSAIWARLRPLLDDRKSSGINSVVDGLKQSVLKSCFLSEIIEELSSKQYNCV